SAHPFLLSYDNILQAGRLTSVEDVLGVETCGADNRCMGVLGAGQIDLTGAFNSTRLSGGKFLVGSGGACDIAAGAREVMTLTRCATSRLVREVDYVTSPGHRVTTIVTDLCVFSREATKEGFGWVLSEVYPAHGGKSVAYALEVIGQRCPWNFRVPT